MRKVVFVILDRFAEWESAYLSMALLEEMEGRFSVRYASTDTGPKRSIGGLAVLPDMAVADIPEDTDALVLIGAKGSWKEGAHGDIRALAERFMRAGKVVAAICGAAWWLSSVGLTDGVRHTFDDPKEMDGYPAYRNPGGYVREESVRDGRVVTGNGNSPVAFAADVLRAMEAAPEDWVREFTDFYTIGYHAAMRKYGYAAQE
ncbi:MAG TPA: DJ-1/PfpI family protein [Candidatus Limnocylindria bacterium]|nr:DJ-1/PfpI family protein [Candidatus Limnocylindria bacterium]